MTSIRKIGQSTNDIMYETSSINKTGYTLNETSFWLNIFKSFSSYNDRLELFERISNSLDAEIRLFIPNWDPIFSELDTNAASKLNEAIENLRNRVLKPETPISESIQKSDGFNLKKLQDVLGKFIEQNEQAFFAQYLSNKLVVAGSTYFKSFLTSNYQEQAEYTTLIGREELMARHLQSLAVMETASACGMGASIWNPNAGMDHLIETLIKEGPLVVSLFKMPHPVVLVGASNTHEKVYYKIPGNDTSLEISFSEVSAAAQHIFCLEQGEIKKAHAYRKISLNSL